MLRTELAFGRTLLVCVRFAFTFITASLAIETANERLHHLVATRSARLNARDRTRWSLVDLHADLELND